MNFNFIVNFISINICQYDFHDLGIYVISLNNSFWIGHGVEHGGKDITPRGQNVLVAKEGLMTTNNLDITELFDVEQFLYILGICLWTGHVHHFYELV